MKPPAFNLLAHLSFWLATIAMLVMGWTLYNAVTNEIESSRRVSHTQEVRQAAGEVNELLSRAESAQRGYLLSGRAAFLSERDPSLARLNDAVAQVSRMTADFPDQQRRITEIEKMIDVRIARMRESARQRLTGSIETARARAAAGSGQETSARIHDLVAELRQDELRRLRLLREEADDRHETEQRALIAAVLFGILALIPGYLAFVLQTRAGRRTEKKLRVMADSLPGAMYQLRYPPKGEPALTFMSSGVTNVLGVRPFDDTDALPGWQSTVDAIDARDRPGFVAALAEAVGSLTAFRCDYRVKHADGSVKWLHHEASLLREDDGSLLQNGYVADITAQRRLEDALQDAKIAADSASRAKSTFLATMSHEIRTPMNGVLGMLELLGLTNLDAGQRGTLEIVRESSRSLLRIIDDILDFSKIEAGKLEIRPEAASLGKVVEAVRNIYSGNASNKGLLLTQSIDSRISPALLVDPMRLRQILSNFVGNALKFTSRGSIEIKAELVGRASGEDQVRISVRDTGIGISADNQQRLFEPFTQGDDDPARRVEGTGLGLAICQRLAGMMGGRIEMQSEPGKGTTMTLALSLPIADPGDLVHDDPGTASDRTSATTAMRRPAPGVAEAENEGTLVLVVDDHPTNRALLVRQVHALGYTAESAENGLEGLGKWQSGRFGLVITDCNMPEMDGYELARSIRRIEARGTGKRTPIIACTAYALGGEAETCLAAGMDDYLAKPVELTQIVGKLDRWLPIPAASVRPPTAACEAKQACADAPIDRSVLAAMLGGDAATERDVLTDFRRTNDADAAILEQAVAEGDVPKVTRATHRMLGASRMVGAHGLAGVCERIGNASRTRNWDSVKADMGAFHREWSRLNAYVDAL